MSQKESAEKKTHSLNGTLIMLTAKFSAEIMETKRQWYYSSAAK